MPLIESMYRQKLALTKKQKLEGERANTLAQRIEKLASTNQDYNQQIQPIYSKVMNVVGKRRKIGKSLGLLDIVRSGASKQIGGKKVLLGGNINKRSPRRFYKNTNTKIKESGKTELQSGGKSIISPYMRWTTSGYIAGDTERVASKKKRKTLKKKLLERSQKMNTTGIYQPSLSREE